MPTTGMVTTQQKASFRSKKLADGGNQSFSCTKDENRFANPFIKQSSISAAAKSEDAKKES